MMSFFLTFYELINSIRPILRNLSISSKFYQLVWTSSNLALDHFFWEKLFVRCIWFSKWKEAILNEEMNSAPMKNNNFRLWEKSFVNWSQSLVVFLKGLFLARMNCWGGRVVSAVACGARGPGFNPCSSHFFSSPLELDVRQKLWTC